MFLPSSGGKQKEEAENWLSQAKGFVSQYVSFIWTVGRKLAVIFSLCALSILLLSKAFAMPSVPLNKHENIALTSIYAVKFYQYLLSQISSWPEYIPFYGSDNNFNGGNLQILVSLMASILAFIVMIMMIYALRHVFFTLNRLFGNQRHPYLDIDCARWPLVTVFIAAHNEEKVIEGCLKALLNSNYPVNAMRIVPVNDRSSDGTRDIIDHYVRQFPGRITPFHRVNGKPGKAAALKDALVYSHGDLAIIFDADYIPGKGLLKQLIAPFFDPEVGAVMGRVVPINAGVNLLTRMLDLERSGGYQVDQQARMNLKLVPQYGGTVGGVRLSAVEASGGWHDNVLAEDTDITYRLLINGWKTIYTNRSECYEEVPEDWAVRIKQVKRWAKGHNQVLVRYWYPFIKSEYLSVRERIDGLLLLLVFVMPPLLLLGWFLAVALYFLNAGSLVSAIIPVFALLAYGTMGNFAAFFEITIAVLLDGNRRRILLLPFNLLGFFISLFAISSSVASLIGDHLFKRDMVWEKTIRYRKA
ncbi:glycosyltransferase family 2 protein [Undibacterium sp. Ji67W]|uniref:glycosyltransferase family 2 protein n=1 Tax=Undibacterium sp. Ji67W TaxID=3413042 RepID=UPI003BF3E4B3